MMMREVPSPWSYTPSWLHSHRVLANTLSRYGLSWVWSNCTYLSRTALGLEKGVLTRMSCIWRPMICRRRNVRRRRTNSSVRVIRTVRADRLLYGLRRVDHGEQEYLLSRATNKTAPTAIANTSAQHLPSTVIGPVDFSLCFRVVATRCGQRDYVLRASRFWSRNLL